MNLLFFVLALVIAELALLTVIAEALGSSVVLAEVIVTLVAGLLLVRFQGTRGMTRLHEKIALGEDPRGDLLRGFAIMTAGLALIIPGVMTDIAGLLLLIPAFRNALRPRIVSWIRKRTIIVSQPLEGSRAAEREDVIEGEYTVVEGDESSTKTSTEFSTKHPEDRPKLKAP